MYQRDPIFIFQDDYDNDNVREILTKNRIGLIPIVDKNKQIVDFVTWEIVFGNNREPDNQHLDIPVVIMAGGKGTRLKPFTMVLPKPLLPLADKTVVDHIIGQFMNYGIREIYLIIHYMPKVIRAYFEENVSNCFLEIVEEDKPGGTAGGLRLLSAKLKRPFIVSNCDILVDLNYADLYHFHKKRGYDMTLVASTKQFDIPYGICDLNDNGSLKVINEKPEYNLLVNTGLYILIPSVLELIPDKPLFDITDLIDKVNKNNGIIGVYPVSDKAWVDIGQWTEYRKASKLNWDELV